MFGANYKGKRIKKDLLESAHEKIVKSTARFIANNTLEYNLEDGTKCIQFQDTIIAELTPSNVWVLNSGGWRTNTTKERLNTFVMQDMGLTLYQEAGVWYLAPHGRFNETTEFFDGIMINESGIVVNEKRDNNGKESTRIKETVKKIKAYRAALLTQMKESGVPLPDSGDCWYCAMITGEGDVLGDAFEDTSHLESHLDEKYIMGSLIWNALVDAGYQSPGFIIGIESFDSIARAVTSYFKKRLSIAR